MGDDIKNTNCENRHEKSGSLFKKEKRHIKKGKSFQKKKNLNVLNVKRPFLYNFAVINPHMNA